MAVKVIIDRRRCVEAGTCIALAPSAFEWRTGDPQTGTGRRRHRREDTVREVAAAYPIRAIVLEEVIETLSG